MKIDSTFSRQIFSAPIDSGLYGQIELIAPSSVFVLADENTATHCLPLLRKIHSGNVIEIPAGEENKTLDSCQIIWNSLIQLGADRQSLLLNVGGGMICDLGGFAASCYQRGIAFAHVPTSLLAMADAAIGGKTGVDYAGLKNYIGIVRQPAFIWIDQIFLNTLPQIEKISGLVEIIKHAIVGSPELWDELSGVKNIDHLDWSSILEKSLKVKLTITEADPFEEGIRKILNFGHTMGHALESHYLKSTTPLTHGQSVCLGMILESRISYSMGLLANEDFMRITRILINLCDPVSIALPTFEALKPWIARDKKNAGDSIRMSLPDRIGSCGWDITVNDNVISESFDWMRQAQTSSGRLS